MFNRSHLKGENQMKKWPKNLSLVQPQWLVMYFLVCYPLNQPFRQYLSCVTSLQTAGINRSHEEIV